MTDQVLVRSLDSGKTWTRWPGNLPSTSRLLQLKQSGTALFTRSLEEAYWSADGGGTWTELTHPEAALTPARFPSDFEVVDSALFTISSEGLTTSADGGRTWRLVPHHPIRGPILSLSVQGDKMLAHAERGIFRSGDSGITWVPSLPAGDSLAWTASAGSHRLFAVGSGHGTVRFTTDAGVHWSRPYALPISSPVAGLALLGGSIFARSAGRLWRLAIPDSAWIPFPLPVPDTLRVLASGPDAAFLATENLAWEMGPDGSLADRSAGLPAGTIMGAWYVEGALHAYSSDGYLHQWLPTDASWKRLLPRFDRPVHTLAGWGNHRIAATYMDTRISEDGGGTWTYLPSRPQQGMQCLVYDQGRVYGGDAVGGVWRVRLPPAAVSIRPRSDRPAPRHRLPPGMGDLLERNRRLDGRWMPR